MLHVHVTVCTLALRCCHVKQQLAPQGAHDEAHHFQEVGLWQLAVLPDLKLQLCDRRLVQIHLKRQIRQRAVHRQAHLACRICFACRIWLLGTHADALPATQRLESSATHCMPHTDAP